MKRLIGVVVVVVAAGALPCTAAAHQTALSNGARVTMHVSPDDAPRAGSPSTVTVTRVAVPRRARFTWGSCGCRLRVTDSSGTLVTDRRITRRARLTFPRAGAYRLVVRGSYRRGATKKSFRAAFSIRAF